MSYQSVREWAHAYRERGLAIARILAGEKRPTYRAWNTYSYDPDRLTEQDGVGIQSGRLSDDLVCVDIDAHDAIGQADRYLPKTALVDGRPGKPRSHRWFRVVDVEGELAAGPNVGVGGGPRTFQFRGESGMVVEFRGTGAQAVVPPSLWTNADGTRQERRSWDSFGEPAVLGCGELLDAVARFASAFGARNTRWERLRHPQPRKRSEAASGGTPEFLPLPTTDAARRARAYVRRMAPTVEGDGGDRQTFQVACVLVRDFALPVDDALPILLEYNQRCEPPWPVEALVHKLAAAADLQGPRGSKLRRRTARTVDVRIRPGDNEVIVGVDCATPDASYIDLAPDLWAALVRHGHTFDLLPKLAGIDWAGRRVTLATPSNVATNKKVVLDEFRLAYLLRQRGADVWSARVPSRDGRRQTVAQAEAIEVVRPPQTAHEAIAAAQAAARQARSRPRKKVSRALENAIAWLRERGAEHATADLVRQARRARISERTLKRALGLLRKSL